MLRHGFVGLIVMLVAGGSAWAQSSNQQTLNELLESVKRGQAEGRTVNAERERRFINYKNEQETLYRKARAEAAELDKRAEALRARFSANEKDSDKLKTTLKERSGDLEQLGTVFRQAAGDTQALLADSLVSAELPERLQVLTSLSRTEGIPAPADRSGGRRGGKEWWEAWMSAMRPHPIDKQRHRE